MIQNNFKFLDQIQLESNFFNPTMFPITFHLFHENNYTSGLSKLFQKNSLKSHYSSVFFTFSMRMRKICFCLPKPSI